MFFPGINPQDSLRIGIMPLLDAAPIVVAERLGFFADQGLRVSLSRERAWASVRDKLAAGVLDAAQMLAPMPLATSLGLDPIGVPLVTALVLSRNGNSITLSSQLRARLCDDGVPTTAMAWSSALKRHVDSDRRAGRPPLTLAHVFPFSSHAYQLRYWLAAAAIHPDQDVNLVVVPPPLMVDQLARGRIDGFCVGAPWGAVSMETDIGHTIVHASAIWPDSPEKVLGVTRSWADEHPDEHAALVRALLHATRWLGTPGNLETAARLLASDGFLEVSIAAVRASLPLIRFDGGECQRPWPSEMMWLASQMQRWGQFDAAVDIAAAAHAVCCSQLYEAAARACGFYISAAHLRIEGPWFDGELYDPNSSVPTTGEPRSVGADAPN